jgi:hypothetical protein
MNVGIECRESRGAMAAGALHYPRVLFTAGVTQRLGLGGREEAAFS